jgi:hypothetical protein
MFCGWSLLGIVLQAYDFPRAQKTLSTYCAGCHAGAKPSGGFRVDKLLRPDSVDTETRGWNRMLARVRDAEMPPRGAHELPAKEREEFVGWVDGALRTAACADGITPRPGPVRRLNRMEYSATVRDLFNIHINAGRGLPSEGAGGEGFDNAAETLTISPIHAEKYLEAAKLALGYALAEPKSRDRFLIAQPGPELTPEQAARKVLEAFVPRAYRRPLREGELDRYLALFAAARKRGDNYELALSYALQGVLLAPQFLFRLEAPNPDSAPRPVDGYAYASRLSYFLWGSMPDPALLKLAGEGKLSDRAVVRGEIERMLKDPKAVEFAESFVEQWLNTRELGRDIKPDEKLFPDFYDAEINSAIKYEPVLFFQEVLAGNLSLLELIDSKWTILTNKLARYYGLTVKEPLRQQPKRIELPEGSRRGGLPTMAAVLAVSSYPTRTSPVLRGKWILEAMLGTPPPPPPPDVPQLPDTPHGAAAKTVRERLALHRSKEVCAGCHNKIDPLGFGLENFTVTGKWRDTDGTGFAGPDGLKKVLLERRELFVRHLTSKLLGYALGRGLNREDHCAVEQIVAKLKTSDYKAQVLVEEIVWSVPFRYQPGTQTQLPAVEATQ